MFENVVARTKHSAKVNGTEKKIEFAVELSRVHTDRRLYVDTCRSQSTSVFLRVSHHRLLVGRYTCLRTIVCQCGLSFNAIMLYRDLRLTSCDSTLFNFLRSFFIKFLYSCFEIIRVSLIFVYVSNELFLTC